MQQVIFQQLSGAEPDSRTGVSRQGRQLPAQASTPSAPACNDECYLQEESPLKMMMSVLANTIGGAILLTAMFNLPVILAAIWGI